MDIVDDVRDFELCQFLDARHFIAVGFAVHGHFALYASPDDARDFRGMFGQEISASQGRYQLLQAAPIGSVAVFAEIGVQDFALFVGVAVARVLGEEEREKESKKNETS
jgi:hypothetical protein